jgi:signal transduction histidine kinase
MPKKRLTGFTVELFLFFILPLSVLLLAVVLISQSLHHDAMRSMVGDRDLRTVRTTANSLSQQIAYRANGLKLLANRLAETSDPQKVLSLAEQDTPFLESGLIYFNNQQVLISASPRAQGWKELPAQLRLVWPNLSNPPSGISFGFQLITQVDRYFLAIGVPVSSKGILIALFPTTNLIESAVNSVAAPENTAVLVFGPDHQILHQNKPLGGHETMSLQAGAASALSGQYGVEYAQHQEGEHVIAYAPVTPVGWGLAIQEDWGDIASPLLTLTQTAPLILIPILILALLALFYAARQIIRPLQALERKAGQLAGGDFDSIHQPVGGIGEIRELQVGLAEMAGRLQNAQQSLQMYIGAITSGVENERRSLARELHDETLQDLIALNQRVQMARRQSTDPRLMELQTQVQELIQNLRRVIRGLRPVYLDDLGLAAALRLLVEETQKNNTFSIVFKIEGEEHRLDAEVELALYRMAQEAISNISRHAQANQARLTLSFYQDHTQLTIEDDGKGFTLPEDKTGFARQGHFGLLGLYERAELIGAQIEIQTSLQAGTKINISCQTSNQNISEL